MPEREPEAAAPRREPREARTPQAPGAPSAAARLAGQVGNRAMSRMLARMETTEAVEALEAGLAPGVIGAERGVVDTLTAFSADTGGFDQVSKEFEKKVEAPLVPQLGRVPGAAEQIPEGWYPGISGE